VTAGGQSTYGYIGALVIQAHNNYDDSGKLVYNPSLYMLDNRQISNSGKVLGLKGNLGNGSSIYQVVSVYPNPFDQEIKIALNSSVDDELELSLFSVSGKLMDRQVKDVVKGKNLVNLRPSARLSAGVYMLSIRSKMSSDRVTVKLIRR
jgi:hypothetical protein